VRLLGANIGVNLECDHGQFINTNAIALNACGALFGGFCNLRNGFTAKGAVYFMDTTIGKSVDCSGGEFVNGSAVAFSADGTKVGGSMYMRNGFKAEGEVRIFGATIGRNLEFSAGQLINRNAIALTADGVNVGNCIYFTRSFKADGEVRLLGASIGGNLECDGAQFNGPSTSAGSYALHADAIKINGSVYLRMGFEANGKVGFTSAYVAHHFQWHHVKSPEKAAFDLRSAKVGTFCDEEKSWPNAGNLLLDGFVYDEIQHLAPTDAKTRIKWIKRQPRGQFLPQPYEQLAKVLQKMGHDDEVAKVMIEKNDDVAHRIAFFHPGRWLEFCFKLFVGYGYRPWRAFGWSLLIIAIGTLLFSFGDRVGIMTPIKENAYVLSGGRTQRLSENYPKFNSFIYSLEMFTPLLKLEMGEYWQPNANCGEQLKVRGILLPTNGSLLRDYLWFHIIFGWVLTTLWVGALTGLVKK
jgi:sRNA-binding regulator protein Hfq